GLHPVSRELDPHPVGARDDAGEGVDATAVGGRGPQHRVRGVAQLNRPTRERVVARVDATVAVQVVVDRAGDGAEVGQGLDVAEADRGTVAEGPGARGARGVGTAGQRRAGDTRHAHQQAVTGRRGGTGLAPSTLKAGPVWGLMVKESLSDPPVTSTPVAVSVPSRVTTAPVPASAEPW